jgi:hypothetical protein
METKAPVTLESLDQKVSDLTTEVRAVKESIGPAFVSAMEGSFQRMRAATEEANDQRHKEAVALTRVAIARHDEALELARANHGALIRKLTETVEAFASRAEVETLRAEVAELRTLVKNLQAKVEARS